MKELFPAARQFIRMVAGGELEEQLPVEFPETRARIPDSVGRVAGDSLCHIEFQSTCDAEMAERMAEYYLALRRAYGRPPAQYVVYVGNSAMTMQDGIDERNMRYQYQIVDLLELEASPLLASDCLEDNLLAVLCKGGAERSVIHEVLRRVAALGGAEREDAISKLLILSGLRLVRAIVEEEIEQMPIEWDIEENWFLKDVFTKGELKGEAKGEVKGRREIVRQLLEQQFGVLPAWALERLELQPTDELKQIASRVLKAARLEDVFGFSPSA